MQSLERMAGALFQFSFSSVGLTIAFALLASVAVKYFARPLPYSTAFLISLSGFAVGMGLFVIYFRASTWTSFSVDGLFALVAMSVAGTIITKLAHTYGIEKTGWLGVGAKSVFVLIGLSGLIVAIVYVYLVT